MNRKPSKPVVHAYRPSQVRVTGSRPARNASDSRNFRIAILGVILLVSGVVAIVFLVEPPSHRRPVATAFQETPKQESHFNNIIFNDVVDRSESHPVIPTQSNKIPEPPAAETPSQEPEIAAKPLAGPVDGPVFAGTIPLDERDGTKPAANARDTAIASGKYREWAALLRRSIHETLINAGPAAQTQQGLSALTKGSALSLALAQSSFLAQLPSNAAATFSSQTHMQPFLVWLLSTPSALESWLLTVRPGEDDILAALQRFSELAQSDEDKTKYCNLAIACALVYEKPARLTWNSKPLTITAAERFAYYKRHAEKHDLVLNPDKLSARNLIWTICAPVPESEMEWALKKLNLRQKSWGNAYNMVEYDMEKAVKSVSKYDSYTFSEILKKGGVCSDRSYFSSNTARAAGIPAATLSGDGDRGPHAWITWLSDDNKWEFSGRYDGYPLGNAQNPQTNKAESEQEFITRSSRKDSDESLLRGMRPVWMAQALAAEKQVTLAGTILDAASRLADDVSRVWQAKLKHWTAYRADASLEEWQAFLDKLKREMKDNMSLLAEARAAEMKFVFSRQDTKTAMRELKQDVRSLERTDRKTSVDQSDQIGRVIRDQAEILKKEGPLEPIRKLYDKAYREHGENAATFKLLASDCWKYVKADPEIAKHAARDMESSFRRYVESGGDYFAIRSQMSVLDLISKCYKEIGESKRAESLAKDVERTNARATRQAL